MFLWVFLGIRCMGDAKTIFIGCCLLKKGEREKIKCNLHLIFGKEKL
jgi:hypothetical protein